MDYLWLFVSNTARWLRALVNFYGINVSRNITELVAELGGRGEQIEAKLRGLMPRGQPGRIAGGWPPVGTQSETFFLMSRYFLNLPMLNLVLSDGRIGSFDEVNELNKQALFALRFQRTPEEFSTFHEDHPTVFDFNLPPRSQTPFPEPLTNQLSLTTIRTGGPASTANRPPNTLPQSTSTDLSQNLNNNAAEALNAHLPSGVTLLDVSAGLYSSDSAVREMSSRVFFQLMVEADYLKYP